MSGSLSLGTGVTLVRERPVLARDASQRRGSHNVLPKGISAMVKMPSKVGKKSSWSHNAGPKGEKNGRSCHLEWFR